MIHIHLKKILTIPFYTLRTTVSVLPPVFSRLKSSTKNFYKKKYKKSRNIGLI